MFEIEEIKGQKAKIRVIGVGGAGGNAVNNMIASNLQGVDFISMNTDMQVLESSIAPFKIQIGAGLTRGLGAGSDPEIGRQAAIDDKASIVDSIDGSDMVFITAGMGGGTGTGAAPVIAGIAKDLGALTVAVVTKPFFYEGRKRLLNAEEGIRELSESVDTLIVIPNDRISLVVEKDTPMIKSFSIANDVLRQAVQGISDIILVPGLINVDFADVKTIMINTGRAVMGSGVGKGEGGAFEAAKKAISNSLIENSSIEGARGILINITGGLELSLNEVQEASSLVYDSAHDDVNVIFGAVVDPDANDEVRVTVIATGFEEKKERIELPEVKKWTPRREPVAFKASERVLAKNLNAPLEVQKTAEMQKTAPEMFNYEDTIDLPTFLRKSPQKDF
jgi:cell division protein FtsZ